jgi:hypothetical protein
MSSFWRNKVDTEYVTIFKIIVTKYHKSLSRMFTKFVTRCGNI